MTIHLNPHPQLPHNPLDVNLVRRSGDMFIAPLDDDYVLPAVPHHVGALVGVPALVLQGHFVTGTFGPVDADVEDVGSWRNGGKVMDNNICRAVAQAR